MLNYTPYIYIHLLICGAGKIRAARTGPWRTEKSSWASPLICNTYGSWTYNVKIYIYKSTHAHTQTCTHKIHPPKIVLFQSAYLKSNSLTVFSRNLQKHSNAQTLTLRKELLVRRLQLHRKINWFPTECWNMQLNYGDCRFMQQVRLFTA